MIIPFAIAGAVWGAVVAWHYHHLGLTLTHYDARGHLVVARRIFDSITPGWQQIGAVWLPLPHLLNAIPVQIDWFYRTGASAVAISIASFAVTVSAIAWIVHRSTRSMAAAIAGSAVFALNPNVLYLQATPMTEPLLLATTTVAIAMLMRETSEHSASEAQRLRAGFFSESLSLRGDTLCGLSFALASLTRYEAWPVTAAAIVAVPVIRWWQHRSFIAGCREAASIALFPVVAIIGFSIFSRVVVGQWFVGSDFFVPENKALGDPMMSLKEIGWGTQMLSGSLLAWIAGIGLAALVVRAVIDRDRAEVILPLALLAMAAVPWSAFVKGHPFRIRYMVPLIAVEAIGTGVVAGAIKRANVVAALAIIALTAYELRPLDANAPMVLEAQWDRPNLQARTEVTHCLDAPASGEKIMASMGSLGHYMQEASEQGFAIRDFLHEGNGDIWLAALDNPRPIADWILIEEKAEGGDMLAKIARARPSFLDGYARVCEGAGLALYKRAEGKGHRATP